MSHIQAVDSNHTESDCPQKILVISDEHRGAQYSSCRDYTTHLVKLLESGQYKHIVQLGDNAELMYIRDNFLDDYVGMLDALTHQGKDYWTTELKNRAQGALGAKNIPENNKRLYDKILLSIVAENTFWDEFLQRHPDITVHKVLGNHENFGRYRRTLNELQDKHPNFEWSPEGIRIGDALFTHGHLPIDQKTDIEYPRLHLHDLEKENRGSFVKAYNYFQKPGYMIAKLLNNPQKIVPEIAEQLRSWNVNGGFSWIHEGTPETFSGATLSDNNIAEFPLKNINHLFFGHTHVPFHGYEYDGIMYHNTGALSHAAVGKSSKVGILEAQLQENGTVEKVYPIYLEKDAALGRACA